MNILQAKQNKNTSIANQYFSKTLNKIKTFASKSLVYFEFEQSIKTSTSTATDSICYFERNRRKITY